MKNRKDTIKKDKLLLQCDCLGGHFMQWLKFWDEQGDEGWEPEMYVCFFGTDISPFWRRIKIAWTIIRYGEWENDGILLNHELHKLKEWLKDK